MSAMDLLVALSMAYISYEIFKGIRTFIIPKILESRTIELEKNPKWITSKANKYYGLEDVDFILAENPYGALPRFRLAKDNRLQLLIPNDTLTRDVDAVIQLALIGKIKAKHDVFVSNKSNCWLSVLCYMLDGGDINENAVKWSDANEKR